MGRTGVMGLTPQAVGMGGLWFAAGLGAAMVVYAWIVERHNVIRRHRLNDCGFVLIFGSTLVMTFVGGGPQSAMDWFMVVVSPVILALALWRLFHTNAPE
jgi:hypothetical protein